MEKDIEFTDKQYDKLVKNFCELLEVGSQSTSFTSLLKRIAEEDIA